MHNILKRVAIPDSWSVKNDVGDKFVARSEAPVELYWYHSFDSYPSEYHLIEGPRQLTLVKFKNDHHGGWHWECKDEHFATWELDCFTIERCYTKVCE